MDGSRSISSTIASRSASRKLMMRGSGIDVVLDRFGRGHRRLLGEADGVLVVLADEDDGELPEPGEREALVEGAHVRRAVAEEAEGHVLLAAVLAPERDAGRDRHVPADDRPAPEEPLGGVEEVHRAAAPAAAPGRAPEE